MKIKVIYWDKKLIEEYETDSIKYEKDGISYTTQVGLHKTVVLIPYEQVLSVEP